MSLPYQGKKYSEGKEALSELPGFSEKKSKTRRKSHSFSYPNGYNVSSAIFSSSPDSSENISQDILSGKIRNLYPDQDYLALVKKLRQEGKLFEDSYFTPSKNILTTTSGNLRYSSDIQWIRPHVSL